MFHFLVQRAVPLTVGFLAGILASAWLDPQTEGGFVLILLTFMAPALAVHSAMLSVNRFRRRANPVPPKTTQRAEGVGEDPAVASGKDDAAPAASAESSVPTDVDKPPEGGGLTADGKAPTAGGAV